MKYQLLCVPENEQSYLYVPADSDPHAKMRIGHLRGDFGCDGDEFWHTWFPCHEELNTQEFKQELGNVVDDLRENTEHPLLKDRRSMASVCGRFPDNCMLNQWHSEWYCFKIVTERYMYYIRCFTGREDYNFYIYCYVNDNPTDQQQDSGKTKERDYICYHVGQVYDRKMDKDGAVFDLIGKMGYINIGFTDMTDEETAVLERGKLEIYLSVIHGLVFITVTFDNKLIMDMPFHAGLYNGFNIEDPKGHGYLVPIIAVDNRDNVIKVLRVTSLDPTFSAVLYALALEQSNGRPLNYDEHLQMIYDRYSQTDIIRKAILKNNGEATV